VGVFIGALTFTGSVIAFGKLQASSAANLYFCQRHLLNLGMIGLACGSPSS